MKKISIIIPVYNAENYLKECIDSILHQSYTNFEIVLIDDGSTDNSPEICEEYAQNDSRIQFSRVQNGGPARIRNIGIRECAGDFVWFIDSDDRISNPDVLKKITTCLDTYKADMLLFLSAEYDEDYGKLLKKQANYKKSGFCNCSGKQLLIELQNCEGLGAVATSPVNKIFSRKVLLDNELFFVERYRWHAEDEFINKVIFNSNGFVFCNEVCYDVRIRPNSITTTINPTIQKKKILTRFDLVETCCRYYDAKSKDEEFRNAIFSYYSYYYLFGASKISLITDSNDKAEIKEAMKNNDSIFGCMRSLKSRNIRFLSYFYKILGPTLTLWLISRRYGNDNNRN